MRGRLVIPGFGPKALRPTPENIMACYDQGVFERAYKCYADAVHFFNEGGRNVPPPALGPAKYWSYLGDPVIGSTTEITASARSSGAVQTPVITYEIGDLGYWSVDRNEDGTAKAAVPQRNMPPHHEFHVLLSLHAWNWWDERRGVYPLLRCPRFVYRGFSSFAEAKRLSFPAVEIEDPPEYPLYLPPDAVAVVEDGHPVLYGLEDAIRAYPIERKIVVSGAGASAEGLDAGKVVNLVDKLFTSAGRAEIAPRWQGDKLAALRQILELRGA